MKQLRGDMKRLGLVAAFSRVDTDQPVRINAARLRCGCKAHRGRPGVARCTPLLTPTNGGGALVLRVRSARPADTKSSR
jgi:hypothetical protein